MGCCTCARESRLLQPSSRYSTNRISGIPGAIHGIVSLGFVQPHSSLCAALTPVTLIGTNVNTGRVDTIAGVRADTIMLSVVDVSTDNLGYTPTFVPANSTSWSVSIADPQHLPIPTDIPCNPAK